MVLPQQDQIALGMLGRLLVFGLRARFFCFADYCEIVFDLHLGLHNS